MSQYWLRFGPNHPTLSSGLSPSFIFFGKYDGSTLAAPGITQPISGWGLYQFSYTPSFAISFVCDGGTTNSYITAEQRYVTGSLDLTDDLYTPLMNQGVTVVNIYALEGLMAGVLANQGTTIVAMGDSLLSIGSTVLNNGALIINQGSTIVGIGNTMTSIDVATLSTKVGSTASSFGGSTADPVDVMGYLKRIQENLEGNATYTKSSGAWAIAARDSTVLATKTLTNTSTTATKS